jgi:hypothetical protein
MTEGCMTGWLNGCAAAELYGCTVAGRTLSATVSYAFRAIGICWHFLPVENPCGIKELQNNKLALSTNRKSLRD